MWVAFVHLRGSKELTKPKALAGYERDENLTKISDAFNYEKGETITLNIHSIYYTVHIIILYIFNIIFGGILQP